MKFLNLLLINLLVNLVARNGLAEQIFPAHAGGTFGRSSREPKYKIEFHSVDSPFHPEEDQESLVMKDEKGQTFLCFLPKVEETKSGKSFLQQNISNMIVESDRRVTLKTPDELMEVLTDRCLLRQEGWWSYEFCHKQHLRQFHVEDDKFSKHGPHLHKLKTLITCCISEVDDHVVHLYKLVVEVLQEFVLGIYDPEATAAFNENQSDISTLKDPRSKDASQRYHAHLYTNGTICDLTNQHRETEVRFVCSEPRVLISSIKEISTCKYAITIHCPMLCKHPMFQEERPVWKTINCNDMTSESKGQEADENSRDEQISTITEIEAPVHYDDSEGYAT